MAASWCWRRFSPTPARPAGEPQAIATATLGATRHIVSTTLTTVAGFMPLLLLSGGEFWPLLAVAIAGGVGLSIILSLVFTPVAYRWIAPYSLARAERPLAQRGTIDETPATADNQSSSTLVKARALMQ